MPLTFAKEEKERYSRQILLFGIQAQASLKGARVLVLGAGGIGSGVLPYLVSSGIGHICIVDSDKVERINLARQTMFSEVDIGFSKGLVAQKKLTTLNPYIEVIWKDMHFSSDNAELLMRDYTLILEGTDDIYNKFRVNDLSLKQNIPALIGGLGSTQGHIFPVCNSSNEAHACYRCLFETTPAAENELPTCANMGILSPLPGVIGSMMAYLTTLFFIEKKMVMNLFLLEKYKWRSLSLQKNPDCVYCNV